MSAVLFRGTSLVCSNMCVHFYNSFGPVLAVDYGGSPWTRCTLHWKFDKVCSAPQLWWYTIDQPTTSSTHKLYKLYIFKHINNFNTVSNKVNETIARCTLLYTGASVSSVRYNSTCAAGSCWLYEDIPAKNTGVSKNVCINSVRVWREEAAWWWCILYSCEMCSLYRLFHSIAASCIILQAYFWVVTRLC